MLSQNFKLMADLMNTPGHADPLQGKNQEHIEKIIPERVFLCSCFLVSSLRAWIFWRVDYQACSRFHKLEKQNFHQMEDSIAVFIIKQGMK